MNPSRTALSLSATDRVPPQSIEAERAALGAMMLGGDASREGVATAAIMLKPEDFYHPAHQRIYSAILSLFNEAERIDLITVTEQLKKQGDLETTGGHAYVAGLVDEMPIAANMTEYAQIIRDKATLRHLMEIGTGIFAKASEDSMEVADIINDYAQAIYDVAARRFQGEFGDMKALILAEIERVERLSQRAGTDMLTGVPTGFVLLDQLTSGLQPGELIIVAARPGMGKTSFALNVAEHVSLHVKIPVIIFSMEMTAEALVRRMWCAHAGVDSQRVRAGRLFGEDRHNLMQAAGVLGSFEHFYIDESSNLSPVEVRAKVRNLLGKTRKQEALVIIDYIQQMEYHGESASRRVENRQQEIAAISRSLKAVAKDLKVPVMAISQLSRAPEQRRGRDARPRLSDLRESGAIEQDADVVLFLSKEENPEQEGASHEDQQWWNTRVSVAKQRNGPTGSFLLHFNRAVTRFTPVEKGNIEPETE